MLTILLAILIALGMTIPTILLLWLFSGPWDNGSGSGFDTTMTPPGV